MDYEGFSNVMVGAPKTGKTSSAMKEFKKKTYRVILFIIADDDDSHFKNFKEIKHTQINSRLTGVFKLVVSDDNIEEIFKYLFDHFKGHQLSKNPQSDDDFLPVAILLDDARTMLHPRNRNVASYFKRRRQKVCDIISNCHGASEFPKELFKSITHIQIFYSTDSTKSIEERMNSELSKIFKLLVEYTNTIGRYGFMNRNKYRYFSYKLNLNVPPLANQVEGWIREKWWLKE